MRYFDEIAKRAQLARKNGGAERCDLTIWLEAEKIVMDLQQELKENVEEKESVQSAKVNF